ncbi:hypothetical protein EHI8A_033900 [Entamoeba histolytica HM-1:IMSS-B]|uniref:Nucleosome assembly protein n=6 Tax=Entamoeba histolytica TaxID=5759 RepID=C4LZ63_ENTH1|nr:hypothetical protein EHI_104530 [Entamoeba histolytica HM-1:IMSS]EMD43721.1 Hypothetical protein EHI5A_057870 [Entamoeba histolytica KU27]EMH73943.1 hypothetical protein EHI8A_033900 [Entamoeba histolytica HM-1:IMSS-B]EMS12740.1 hypothetical protein KM1_074600 [Entamoeba histolytica HM-3:IMSS]ENY60876.1 hypothetical protein EHI7A_035750 [Entamoeba histolytica HM-1:IMSS-A]GAT94140.1 hypothetical protein CL6EHI_104530 [Entamoeba histolytica]|eukprot:XP_655034.1 hypothetical protein EHI_104530 [Entamoeba histolytica HM-1:IMSS]
MAQTMSCIDMIKMMDIDDSSEDSETISPNEETDISSVKYKTYLSITSSQVHKNLHALRYLQKESSKNIFDYYRVCSSEELILKDQERKSNEEMMLWIEGKKELSIPEQMKFVVDRWNTPCNTAKFKGIPCFWGRIIKRLPYFTPNTKEYPIIEFIKNIDVIKKPLSITQNGFQVKYQIIFQYNENEYISNGASIELTYVLPKEFPINQITEPNVSIINDNIWKNKIELEEGDLSQKTNFFSVFNTDNKDKQFIYFYILAKECVTNKMRWFDDSIVQIKDMKNLSWSSIKEFDYANECGDRIIDDKASLPCVQQ